MQLTYWTYTSFPSHPLRIAQVRQQVLRLRNRTNDEIRRLALLCAYLQLRKLKRLVALDMGAEPYFELRTDVEHRITVSSYNGAVQHDGWCGEVFELLAQEL